MRKRYSKIFTVIRIMGLFFMGLVVAVVVALSQVNLESLRGSVLGILRDATGLPVEIDGGVSWKFSLRPRVELNQVRVPNADWAKHEYAFSAEKIDVTLNLISLFRARPTIQNVKIYDATVCFEQNADGAYSVNRFNNKRSENTVGVSDEKNALDASENGVAQKTQPQKYPFRDLGLGGVEVRNLVAHIFDSTYSVTGFSIRHMPRGAENEYSGWIKSDEDVFPFIVSFSEYDAERKVYPMRVAFSTGGDALIANVALEGASKMPIDFIIKGDIPDVAAIGRVFNLDLADVPALKVNLAGGLGYDKLTLRKSSVFVRDNNFTISGSVNWAGSVPEINLNVAAGKLSLMDLFPDMYKSDWVRPNRELNIFKNIPLYGDVLYGRNVRLNLKVDKLRVYRDLSIKNIDLDARLDGGVGYLDLDAMIGDGDIKIVSDVDIAPDGNMDVRMAARGEKISVGKILSDVNTNDFISDLPSGVRLYLVGSGRNLSELMQTVTGPVQVFSQGGGYAHSALVANMYGTDFLTSLRHGIQDLFRPEKKYNQMKIECVAVNTKFRNGVAETQHGVAIETNAINVRMAGNINLGDEKLHLSLTTVPVRGLKLSLTGNVMNSIEFSGNLAEPDVQISGSAIAGKVASATGIGLLLAPFTGGLSLVAGAGVGLLAGDLLENWLADGTPCETAMSRGAPMRRDDPDWMGMSVDELIDDVFNG